MFYPSWFWCTAFSCFLRHDCFQFWNALVLSSAPGTILKERQGEFLKEPDNRIIFTRAVTVLSHWNTSLLVLLLQPALTLKGTLLLVLTSLTNVRTQPWKEAVGTSYISTSPLLHPAGEVWVHCALTELTQVQASSARSVSVPVMRPLGII